MKGSRLEPDSGFVQRSDASAAFVSEVYSALEKTTAFDELQELARHEPEGDLDAIRTWARKWGVNQPRMRDEAKKTVDDMRRGPEEDGWRQVSRGEAVPEAWLHKLKTLTALPVTTSADDGVASGTMSVRSERNPGVSNVIGAPLEQLLEQDHILGPIATNPIGESLEQFLERARHHWQGRA